jgi:hypothetical protein
MTEKEDLAYDFSKARLMSNISEMHSQSYYPMQIESRISNASLGALLKLIASMRGRPTNKSALPTNDLMVKMETRYLIRHEGFVSQI